MTIAFDSFAGWPISKKESRKQWEYLKPLYAASSHVFIAHGHFDHIIDIPFFYADFFAPIYGTHLPCHTLINNDFPMKHLRLIAPGWKARLDPSPIQTWQGKHSKFDMPLILQTIFSLGVWCHLPHMIHLGLSMLRHPKGGKTLFYQVSVGTLLIQIMGSLNSDPDIQYPVGRRNVISTLPRSKRPGEFFYGHYRTLAASGITLDHWDNTFPFISKSIDTSEFRR